MAPSVCLLIDFILGSLNLNVTIVQLDCVIPDVPDKYVLWEEQDRLSSPESKFRYSTENPGSFLKIIKYSKVIRTANRIHSQCKVVNPLSNEEDPPKYRNLSLVGLSKLRVEKVFMR